MILKARMFFRFTILLLCCCHGEVLHAQIISAADSAWFQEMANKTNQFINENPQRADSFARAYFAKARSLHNDEYAGKGACLVQMGASMLDPKNAKSWYDTAQVYLQLSKNHLWNGYLNMNYGIVLNRQYSFEPGIQYLIKSISFFERAKDTTMIAMAYRSIANAFHDFGNYEKGKSYAQQGLKILDNINEKKPGVQWSLLTVLGINYDDNKEYSQAIATHLKALSMATGNDEHLSSTYNNLGNTYKKKGMLNEAANYFEKSFEKAKIANNNYHMATIYGNLGDIARLEKKYPLANKYLDSCLYYSTKSASPEKLKDAYQYYSFLLEETGSYKRSLYYLNHYIHLKDSLEGIEKARIVYDMQERYESEKKEKQNRDLQLSNELKTIEKDKAISEKKFILFTSAILIALLSVLAFLIHRNKLGKLKRSEEQKMNQALFTGEQNERIRIARDLHDGVGQMLSLAKMNLSSIPQPDAIQKNTIQLIDQTINEVRNISHNLIPEDLNFGLFSALETLANKINDSGITKMDMHITDEIRKLQFDKENELSIYRIVQEVISNMTRHAQASTIHLNIRQEGQKIILSIRDNGIGMDAESIEKSKGIGWKNIKARVNLLDGEMKVLSEKLSGTEIEISIPG